MKINSFKSFAAMLFIIALIALSLPFAAQAQVEAGPKRTRAAGLANTNLVTLGNYTNTTYTFAIKRGRGFGFNASGVATNASTSNLVFVIQFATPHTNSGTLTTNWSTDNNLTINFPLAGTTTQFWQTNIGPLACDNQALGRLYWVSNSHLSTVSLNLTNTFFTTDP